MGVLASKYISEADKSFEENKAKKIKGKEILECLGLEANWYFK